MPEPIAKSLFILYLQLIIIGCNKINGLNPKYDESGKQVINQEWISFTKKTFGSDINIDISRTFDDTVNIINAKLYSINPDLKIENSPSNFNSKNEFKVDTIKGRILNHHKFFLMNGDTVLINIRHSKVGKHSFDGVGILMQYNLNQYYYIDTVINYEVIRK